MFYVILTISYLRAQTIETSSLPTDSSRPLFKHIAIFSGILTVYFKCKYFPYYTRQLLGCLLWISPLGEIPAGAIIHEMPYKRLVTFNIMEHHLRKETL